MRRQVGKFGRDISEFKHDMRRALSGEEIQHMLAPLRLSACQDAFPPPHLPGGEFWLFQTAAIPCPGQGNDGNIAAVQVLNTAADEGFGKLMRVAREDRQMRGGGSWVKLWSGAG